MRVYIVQHGEAASKDADPERRLTTKGVEDVKKLAEFLKPLDISCTKIYHGSKARAKQTAEILAPALGGMDRLSTRQSIAPLDSIESILSEFNSWDEDTALVGHMPFVGKLVSGMVAHDESLLVATFKPGAIVCIENDEEGRWHIAWMITPGC